MFFAKKKTIWEQYGKWMVSAAVVAACGYGAMQYYDHLQAETTFKASALYDQMIMGAFSEGDKSEATIAAEAAAKMILEQYKETTYAPIAALYMSKLAVEKKDLVSARHYLELAIKEDDVGPIKPIATVRLARLLAEEKKYREAMDLLTAIDPEGYQSLFAETKGDVYWLQGEKDKARMSYQSAIKLSPKSVPTSRLEIKLAELGLEEKL